MGDDLFADDLRERVAEVLPLAWRRGAVDGDFHDQLRENGVELFLHVRDAVGLPERNGKTLVQVGGFFVHRWIPPMAVRMPHGRRRGLVPVAAYVDSDWGSG